ncbi:MAG: carboxymuconolactone decarboxylase family protein [Gemmatimonadales bacterium]
MARIPPLDYADASPQARAAHDHHKEHVGRITNMKRTLLRSLPAFDALMTWYPLRDTVQPFLGERLTHLFAHAVSTETDCLICSTFFRRLLIQSGENPDALKLNDQERAVVEYGRQMGRDAHAVTDQMYTDLAAHFTPEQIVALTAFGAIMLATNVFNNALRVDLDQYLEAFRVRVKAADPAGAH